MKKDLFINIISAILIISSVVLCFAGNPYFWIFLSLGVFILEPVREWLKEFFEI